jgi:hypothetical protein
MKMSLAGEKEGKQERGLKGRREHGLTIKVNRKITHCLENQLYCCIIDLLVVWGFVNIGNVR